MAETSYAPCGDLSLAYQVFGDGPIEMVFVGPFVSHIELFWTLPEFKSFFDHLATFCRVVIFDKAGLGLSDPIRGVRTLDQRAEEIEAVMDAVGFSTAVIFGMSEGGTAAMLFAATRPQRTRALVVYASYPFMSADWADLDSDPGEVYARLLAEADETDIRYLPTTEQLTLLLQLGLAVRDHWGTGIAAGIGFPSIHGRRQLAMFERMSASPGMARATIESLFHIDIRAVLPTLALPTLVIHSRDDKVIPVPCGRYLADHIPAARYLEVGGADHAPWHTEPNRILAEVENLVTGTHHTTRQAHRALRTVLFTDIVASTERAAACGDQQWRVVLQRFNEITGDLTTRHGGTVVKSTGDGHLATFDGPTQAIRCAAAVLSDAEALGIELRAGIHTGECELLDADIGGIAVHIAARILGHAGAGDIVVSSTVRDLVVGSGTSFEDRGVAALRGVPGTWQLLAVDRTGTSTSPEAVLAAQTTPAPGAGMHRTDRAVAAMARHTPWLLRGLSHFMVTAGPDGTPAPTVRS